MPSRSVRAPLRPTGPHLTMLAGLVLAGVALGMIGPLSAPLLWPLAAVVLAGLLLGGNLGIALRDAAAVCRGIARRRT